MFFRVLATIAHMADKRKKRSFSQPRVEFARGILGTDPILHDGKTQIAFVGRSNVGKSSAINALLGMTIARTSSTPGKTQEINFYLVEGKFYFVDLPGYGYANLPAKEAEKIRKYILWYLTSGEVRPKLIVLIIDARVGITSYDQELIALARENEHSILVLANKIDKLTKNERAKILNKLAEEFSDLEIIPFSALKKENVALVRKRLGIA